MKEESSDFLKYAYEHGRVRDVSEAFKEFPPEEEWHKGEADLNLKEDDEDYYRYAIGDIVFVKEFYYANGKKGKNHLFVIIAQNNMAVPIENFGMLISSRINKVKYNANKMLKKDKTNNLKKDSIVKTDVIYKICSKQILFKIGSVDEEKIEEYKKSFYNQ